ncbi:MAG: FAD-binding oxidoreductase, partial [Microbacteriaceae bacterium]
MDTLTAAVASILRPQITGPVLVRGDATMTAETSGFNALTVHDPDVAVGVASEADVVAAVQFAVQHQLPVSIQSTGHGAYTSVSGGMLLLTKRLDTLVIDPGSRTATIGAGLTWAPVIAAAAKHGLMPLTGSAPEVGAVGFTLGGGLGPLSRSFGIAADRVRSFRVVTADGHAVIADATENPELFWALRGGKGGLGVVTEMQVELIALEAVYGGGLFFGADDIETVLRAWVDWTGSAPDSVTSSVAVLRVPDIEEMPPPLRGKTVLHLRYAYVGEPGQSAADRAAEGERLLAPLRAAAPVYLDLIGELPASAVGQIHNDPDQPMPVWDRG